MLRPTPLPWLKMFPSIKFQHLQSTPLAGNLKHSIFSAKLVNRTAFGNSTWVMDTGASDRIICSISFFQTYTTVANCVVELPNGESAHVTHVGTVKLSNFLTLEHVLYVPSFSFNLLSVSQLTHSLPLCLVYLLQKSNSRTAPSLSNLASTNKNLKSALSASVSNKDMSILWHFRLGHLSFHKLSVLKDVLPSFSHKCTDICTICPLAKQKRLSFPSLNNMCAEPFSLIHVDVWGPYSVQIGRASCRERV